MDQNQKELLNYVLKSPVSDVTRFKFVLLKNLDQDCEVS